jgi:hypothetical protein
LLIILFSTFNYLFGHIGLIGDCHVLQVAQLRSALAVYLDNTAHIIHKIQRVKYTKFTQHFTVMMLQNGQAN